MFGYILQFELFTGGGGDADEDSHGTQIEAAHKGGIQVGNLTAKGLTKWNSLGWYELFNSQCVILRLLARAGSRLVILPQKD